MTIKTRSFCPIHYALENIGDKWSLLILRDIMLEDKKFFREFMQSYEGIATNILSSRLAKLESNGLIKKERDQQDRKRFIYSPTEKGLNLLPVILAMVDWSATYIPQDSPAFGFIDMVKRDPKKFEKEIRAKFSD